MLKFNTAIAALMTLMNQVTAKGSITKEELKVFTLLLNPFAPHVTEEVWAANALGEGWWPSSLGPSMTRPSARMTQWRSWCRCAARSVPA